MEGDYRDSYMQERELTELKELRELRESWLGEDRNVVDGGLC